MPKFDDFGLMYTIREVGPDAVRRCREQHVAGAADHARQRVHQPHQRGAATTTLE
jgi:hypothetical protein